VYVNTCQPLVDNFFEGFNATVFAYGQTGSGKTYTMGNDGNSSSEGIIPSAVTDIFKKCAELETAGSTTKLQFSYMEVYKEECFDLLSNDKKKCEIRELVNGETVVEGLTHEQVASEKEVQDLLIKVSQVRTTAKTAMNSVSSRSHAICTFTLTTTKQETLSAAEGTTTSVITKSRFHLVDLAGSERAKKTMASGDVFAEGVNINKGLLALGNVIVALSSGAGGHVPYRDSKITRILKDSLGGNSKTVMLACVSPADINFEETLNTLRFSSRASCIVNSVTANRDYSGGDEDSSANSMQLVQEICILREELRVTKQQSEYLVEPDGTNNREVVGLFVKLASFTRSILVKCLEDDVEVNDEEIENARQIIALLKKETTCTTLVDEDDAAGGLDLDFLPPIMKLVDELETLEKQISNNNRDSVGSDCSDYSDSSSSSSSSSSSAASSEDMENNDDHSSSSKARKSIAQVESKQLEVTHMIAMTEQCKHTISQLRQEVKRLEDDKHNASKMSKPVAGAAPVKGQSEKSIQILKEKAKLLENKQKELRKKEIEYAKLMQQKEKAYKEVNILTNELKSAKRIRVEMVKKQKEDSKSHLEEKKKLIKSEHQHRKKELEAQDKASKFQRELTNKDKFMSEKLADKDREIKRLKNLAEKQDNVKQQRAQSTSHKSAPPSQFSANGHRKVLGSRSEELSHNRINELQSWIEKEVETQSSRNYLQEEIQYQMDQRSKDVRRMQALKQQSEAEEMEMVDEELKCVDEDLRTRSRSIAKAQGQLADLGIVVEKRRFAKITDLREAKILLGGMFQKLSYDKLMEQRSLEGKISAQDEEIRQLKESMQKMEAIVAQGAPSRRRKSICTDSLSLAETEQSNSHSEVTKKAKVHLKPALPHFSKKPSFKKPSDDNRDDEDDYDFDIDESFMVDEEEDDDEDYIPESERKRSHSKKRNSKDMDMDSETAGRGGRKRSKGSDASSGSEEEDRAEPAEPLSQYTVPILKSFLAERSLPVSGNINTIMSFCAGIVRLYMYGIERKS
jgi:kinesin family member 4